MMPILAEAASTPEAVTTAKDVFATATNWVSENGIKFAVALPNAAITGGNITNFSAHPTRAVIVPCTVGGNNSTEKARSTLLGATAGNPNIMPEPAPVALLTTLGENKYTMELRARCHPENFWAAQFTLNEAAKKAVDEAGVTGPLPAMRIIQN